MNLAPMCLLSVAAAAASLDSTVIAILRREAPEVRHAVVVERLQATRQEDLVLVLGMPAQRVSTSGRKFAWMAEDRLGLFLQERHNPALVYRLAIAPGPNEDCFASIMRFTAQDLVLSCEGEKWSVYRNQKFVFDIRAKALVRRFSYWPFAVARIASGAGGPRFVMSDGQTLLLVGPDPQTKQLQVVPERQAAGVLEKIPIQESTAGNRVIRTPEPPPDPADEFGPAKQFSLSHRKNRYGSEYPVIVERRGSEEIAYPLPQSSLSAWRAARPDDAATPLAFDPLEMNEQIGPHLLEGDRLWFGKTFYNGEGLTGVGGFGYFDANTRDYRLYSPREIQKWSVSAILVQPDAIWLGLDHRGEYGNTAGGLLRWDRKTGAVKRYGVDTVITAIAQDGNSLYLGAADRIVALRDGSLKEYFVDRAITGRYRLALRCGVSCSPFSGERTGSGTNAKIGK